MSKIVVSSPSSDEFRESWGRVGPAADGGGHGGASVDSHSADVDENVGLGPGEDFAVDTWSTSQERDVYLRRRLGIAAFAIPAGILGLLGWFLARPSDQPSEEWWGQAAMVVALVILTWCLVPYWASRRAYIERRRARAAARVDKAVSEIARAGDLPIAKLFELNRRQLDEYQELTKKQQRSAYLLTQVASVLAFIAVLIGVLVAFSNATLTEKYLSGGLSALGAVLSTFLAQTFFRSHRDANAQLNHYYLEPQQTGRILAAERLARFLNENPGATFAAPMITALLEWDRPKSKATNNDEESPVGAGAAAQED